MRLYRKKEGSNDQWQLAPDECMADKQEAGWEYKYFANDEAAARGTGFN